MPEGSRQDRVRPSNVRLALLDSRESLGMSRAKGEILVADGERNVRIMLKAVLKQEGYEVCEADSGASALKALEREPFDLILMDAHMSDIDGIAAMREIRKSSPFVPVVMMSRGASVRAAVHALKLGAHDYLTKPLDVDEVKILVEHALKQCSADEEDASPPNTLDFTHIIGESEAMRELC